MGKYKFSRFLDEVHERLKKEFSEEMVVDRLWIEWREDGWKKLVRVGDYMPYLARYDGVAIEVLKPYERFRLVNGRKQIEVELDLEGLANVIANRYKVSSGRRIQRWNGRGKNTAGFRERNWWFSDFHYHNLPKDCFMFDLDVVVATKNRIVKAWDIKWGFDHGTSFERNAYRHARDIGIEVEEIYVYSPKEAVEVISYEALLLA